jgi:hypothetical protein
MSGSMENTASSASERPERRDVVLNLATASRMVALVRHIVADVREQHSLLAPMREELEHLDSVKRSLNWPQRQRRYQVRDLIAAAERRLGEALTELDGLGVALVDSGEGRVGFPTIVNDRKAFFSWKLGEEGLHFWHFAGEDARRPIPPTWVKAADIRLLGKS